METFVDEEADFIVHPVDHVQPVQLPSIWVSIYKVTKVERPAQNTVHLSKIFSDCFEFSSE